MIENNKLNNLNIKQLNYFLFCLLDKYNIIDFEKVLASKTSALKQAKEKAIKIPVAAQRQQLLDKIAANEQHIKTRYARTTSKKIGEAKNFSAIGN